MIWETYSNEFNLKRLKLSEARTVNTLTGPTPMAPVNDKSLQPVPPHPRLRRVKTNDFQANNTNITLKCILKPFCVCSSLLLRCFIHHNISFGNHIIYITLNSIEMRDKVRQISPRWKLASSAGLGRDADGGPTRSHYCGRHWGRDGLRRLGISSRDHSENARSLPESLVSGQYIELF